MKTMNRKPYRKGSYRSIFVLLFSLLYLSGAVRASNEADTALFWSVSRDGAPAGYLLGTIHSEDPRVLDFSESFSEALAANSIFAMEIVPNLPTLEQLTVMMQYQDGTTLEERIGSDRYARLLAALKGYSMPADWAVRMKVWAAMMTLSVPPPETGFFMDFSLSLRAAGSGLKVVGLETLEEQLSFLEEMPMEQQLILLDQVLAEHEKVGELHDQMVRAYLAGDLQTLSSQAEDQLAGLGEEARQYFMYQGIELRNRGMIKTLLPLLETDRVFVAVGALHLPGEAGLIRLLRSHGFDLRPLPLPLSVEAPESAPAPAQ